MIYVYIYICINILYHIIYITFTWSWIFRVQIPTSSLVSSRCGEANTTLWAARLAVNVTGSLGVTFSMMLFNFLSASSAQLALLFFFFAAIFKNTRGARSNVIELDDVRLVSSFSYSKKQLWEAETIFNFQYETSNCLIHQISKWATIGLVAQPPQKISSW